MENAILITSLNISLVQIRNYCELTLPLNSEGDSLSFGDKEDSYLRIQSCYSCYDEYDDDTLIKIKKEIEAPIFFIVETNQFELLRKLILSFPPEMIFLVDNNFGKILSRAQLLEFTRLEDFYKW